MKGLSLEHNVSASTSWQIRARTERGSSWILLGAILIAAGYLPTLTAPFDFVDDGNLVYPSMRAHNFAEHVGVWWERVEANVDHLGPFRPVVWAHWELAANTLGADPLLWRLTRLIWCGFAAGCFVVFLRVMNVGRLVSLVVAAGAFWNPSRNDIWTSLTLAEGVAMPYALLALIAARRARGSPRPWRWDALGVISFTLALGCKNTYVALLPAILLLRFLGQRPNADSESEDKTNELPRQNGRSCFVSTRWIRCIIYLLPALLPLMHFIYVKLHPGPCHYDTPGPSGDQALRFLGWMKGAAGLDYLGVGMAGAVVVGLLHARGRVRGFGLGVGFTLLAAGFLVYLPVSIMTGRYTMPAVWGFDLIFGLALSVVSELPLRWPRRVVWASVGIGLTLMTVANVGRQDKLASRSRLLWQVVEHVETKVPGETNIAWVGGSSELGELNVEEGIHFAWHLQNRRRGAWRVALYDSLGRPVERVELPPLPVSSAPGVIPPPTDGPRLRITAQPNDERSLWSVARTFQLDFHHGRKTHRCRVEVPAGESFEPVEQHKIIFPPSTGAPPALDPSIQQLMKQSFGRTGNHPDPLDQVLGRMESGAGAFDRLLNKPAAPPSPKSLAELLSESLQR